MANKIMIYLILGLLVVCLPAGYANAQNLNLSIPCDSGSIDIVGNYDVATGAIDLTFTINNCQDEDDLDNGTITTSGTFMFTSASTANVDLNFKAQVQEISGDGTNLSVSFDATMNGTYNLVTEIFDGTITESYNSSGKENLDIFELLSWY